MTSIPEAVLTEIQALANEAEQTALEIEHSEIKLDLENPTSAASFQQGFKAFKTLAEKMVALGEQYPLRPSDVQHKQAVALVERPLFLCGHAKSGTTLLRNMVDGHSQTMVVPVDGAAGYRPMAYMFEKNKQLWSQEMRVRLTDRLMNPMGLTPPRWSISAGCEIEPYITLNRYQAYWREQFPESIDGDLRAIICALYCASVPCDAPARQYWAEKTARTYELAPLLASLFPSAKFIQIVRHPGAVYSSFKGKMLLKLKSVDLIGLTGRLWHAMNYATENAAVLGPDKYLVIYYEELIQNPTKVMGMIADFLQIKFEHTLISPTVNSHPANPNTAYIDEKATPGTLLPDRVDMWQDKIDLAELEVLEYFLAGQMTSHSYPCSTQTNALKTGINLLKIRRKYKRSSPYLHVGLRQAGRFFLGGIKRYVINPR